MESTVHLNNIKCNGCVKSVNDNLADVSGVQNISVDIPTGKVIIEHDESVQIDQLLEILDEAGYPEK